MPKAIIYCRVSSDRQVKEGHGLDGQELRWRKYADMHGYEVAAVFRDEGVSGGVIATIAGDEQLATQAKALTDKWLTDRSGIDPNMLGSVLSTAAYYGDKALFESLKAAPLKRDRPALRRRLLPLITRRHAAHPAVTDAAAPVGH